MYTLSVLYILILFTEDLSNSCKCFKALCVGQNTGIPYSFDGTKLSK